MSLLFMESFDWIGATGRSELPLKWSGTGGEIYYPQNNYTSVTYGRTGKGCRVSSGDGGLTAGITTSGDTIVLGCAVKRIGTGESYISFVENDGTLIRIWLYTDGSFGYFITGIYPNVVLGGSGSLPLNIWRYLEIKIVIHDTTGSVTIKVDGLTVISYTGIDTKQSAAGTKWSSVSFTSASNGSLCVDDIYILDTSGATCNDFLGDVQIIGLLPQTDAVGGGGANADFTPSTGSDHGAVVDDVGPNGDTDYLSSDTVDHVDTWDFPALGYTGVIKAVAMNLVGKKENAGTRVIAAVTCPDSSPAGTNYVHGTDKYLATDYLNKQSIWELNPEDSAAWEVADVDGAEFGVKITV